MKSHLTATELDAVHSRLHAVKRLLQAHKYDEDGGARAMLDNLELDNLGAFAAVYINNSAPGRNLADYLDTRAANRRLLLVVLDAIDQCWRDWTAAAQTEGCAPRPTDRYIEVTAIEVHELPEGNPQ